MNTQAQTIFSDVMDMLSKMRKQTTVRPFDLQRIQNEAQKLLQTSQPVLGYLCLAECAVLANQPHEVRLAKMNDYLSKALRLPHDKQWYFRTYLNGLVRLGEREIAYQAVEEYEQFLNDDVDGLRVCFTYAIFTGQLSISENILSKLDKLGKNEAAEMEAIKYIQTLISEAQFKELLLKAGHILREHGLINYGSDRNYTEDGFFYDFTVLHDSDESQIAKCDIALSRLKIQFAKEKAIDLSSFMLGCSLGERP